jgi:hypothetical protein
VINEDMYQAIVYYEMSLLNGYRSTDVPRDARADYSAVMEALERETILALCRMWDSHKRTARIPVIADELRQTETLKAIEAKRGTKPPKSEIKTWQRRVSAVLDSKELGILRDFRNQGLAHTESPSEACPSGPHLYRFGHERAVLDPRVEIVDQLNRFFGYPHKGHAKQRAEWRLHAGAFWNSRRRGWVVQGESKTPTVET